MCSSFRYCSRFISLSAWIVFGCVALFAQSKTITILHTNDMHASFLPHEAFWIKDSLKPLIGGFNELSCAVDSLRQAKKWTLLVDDGDVMTGNPITEYDYKGASGGALFEMMNRIGYEAWTPGNHDFDISVANLKKLTEVAKFPTVSANILDTNGLLPVNNLRYVVIEKNNMKIGVIGLMSSDFYNLVNKNSSQGIKILSPFETLQPLVDTLSSRTDLIIALTHQGVEEDSLLAMKVRGLNVIVGGHSHTRLRRPKVVNDVVIVQTGSNCENLGILDLAVENHRIVSSKGELLPLWYNSERGVTPLSMFIDSMKNVIDKDYSKVVAILKTDWNRGHGGESGIGNFIADAQREAVQADVSFMNSSGIRKDKAAGPITKKDIFEILPFRNLLTTFQVTGSQLRSMIEIIIRDKGNVQTSGLRCEWRKKENGGIEFLKIYVNGKLLEDLKTYTGVASDYMMGEAEKYFGMKLGKMTVLNQTVFSAIETKVRTMKEISSEIEHRIHEVKSRL